VIAEALNLILLDDLLQRVPVAADYVDGCRAQGRKIFYDHGALRTVALAGMGNLPAGEEAIVRVLRPLGYFRNAVYPLDRLKMTGRSYTHADMPEQIAQFFVSELHPERFSPAFKSAVRRVTESSIDPLTPAATALLEKLAADGILSAANAAELLPALPPCFERQHRIPTLQDYELLLAESKEMAWISTEGNSFNHATDRVPDLESLSAEQRTLGRPMKDTIEVSSSGRVRQTAFHATMVKRRFLMDNEGFVEKEVPGSFYEFITRSTLPGSDNLDLGFDSSNAQGIFAMTSAK